MAYKIDILLILSNGKATMMIMEEGQHSKRMPKKKKKNDIIKAQQSAHVR